MASRAGPMIAGSDGNDYEFRQRVAGTHHISLLTKSRLKYCIFFHAMLSFAMLAKLLPAILDHLDVFILEIEELEVPLPLWWEYIWLASLLASLIGLSAIRGNKIREMKKYIISIMLFGIIPLIYCFIYYFTDVYEFATMDSSIDLEETGIQLWRKVPYGLLWHAFCVVGLQVHGFSIYFGYSLIKIWRLRSSTRKLQ